MKNVNEEATLLVLSGGLDSFVLAHKLSKERRKFRALYLNFGKIVSKKEIAAVKSLSLSLHFPLEIINLAGLSEMQLGFVPSEFVDRDEADIKEEPTIGDIVYVSGFQMLLGIAAYYAQLTGHTSMTLGIIKEQFDKYPKLEKVFMSFSDVTTLLNPDLPKFAIELPFKNHSKADVVKLGDGLSSKLANSWSCVFGEKVHCGKCSQCLSRKKAFKVAKIKDSTSYLK